VRRLVSSAARSPPSVSVELVLPPRRRVLDRTIDPPPLLPLRPAAACAALQASAAAAQGHRTNCRLLARYVEDALKALQKEGETGQEVGLGSLQACIPLCAPITEIPSYSTRTPASPAANKTETQEPSAVPELRSLVAFIDDARSLTDACAEEGWLARMLVTEGGGKNNFVRVFNALAAAMADCCLPAQSPGSTSAADFHDDASKVKRLLKQVGGGSIEAGLRRVRVDERARHSVAELLDVSQSAIMKETESDLAVASRARRTNALKSLRAMGDATEGHLREAFAQFARLGMRPGSQGPVDLDSFRFSKLCKDSGLVRGALNPQYVDIVFSRAKAHDSRRLGFEEFVLALDMIAEKRGRQLDDIIAAVLAGAGPLLRGTKAGYVKFHDDKTTFTGVYARGGPSSAATVLDLSTVVRRPMGTEPSPRSPGPRSPSPTVPQGPVLSTAMRASAKSQVVLTLSDKPATGASYSRAASICSSSSFGGGRLSTRSAILPPRSPPSLRKTPGPGGSPSRRGLPPVAPRVRSFALGEDALAPSPEPGMNRQASAGTAMSIAGDAPPIMELAEEEVVDEPEETSSAVETP
jgi:hypothetical protein